MPETPPGEPTSSPTPSPEELDRAASASNAPTSHKNTHSSTQDAAKPIVEPEPKTEVGSVPAASPAPVSVLVVNRGADGRWGSTGGRRTEEPANRTMSYSTPKVDIPKPNAEAELERKAGIRGLDAIPKGWPQLPSSVSLGQEIAWVQSERLLIVKEQPSGGIKVDLSKARSPAPSMSALSWLETSIRSYAKFVEVAAKQASSGQDEAEFVRRERMAIGEIRALLEEMKDAGKVDKGG